MLWAVKIESSLIWPISAILTRKVRRTIELSMSFIMQLTIP